MKRKTSRVLLNLLDYITNFQQEKGYTPTVREMAEHLDVCSTCTISYYLDKLCEKGILKKDNKKSRAIEFVIKDQTKWQDILQTKVRNSTKISYKNSSSFFHESTIDIPILGNISAGFPILAVEDGQEKWTLPYEIFNKSSLFILDVKGESMINAGIFDRDKIVVHSQNVAENGDIVVALIEDSVTVKRFYKEQNKIRLQPENDSMSPMFFDDVKIIGKVVGLIRNM